MDSREMYLKRFEMEQPTFGRVLKALPEGQASYTPHEKSKHAGDLAWQLAEEQRHLADMLETGKISWVTKPRPDTFAEIHAAYEEHTGTLRERLAKSAEEKWDQEAQFVMGEHVVGKSKVGDYLWGFLFDMVHHRGQLAAYIRPMGGKVPAIYGPSGDDDGSKK